MTWLDLSGDKCAQGSEENEGRGRGKEDSIINSLYLAVHSSNKSMSYKMDEWTKMDS